jgi:hypothetical protein
MKSKVPEPVTFAGGGAEEDAEMAGLELGLTEAALVGGVASMKAEGGSPPTVSASAAFSA